MIADACPRADEIEISLFGRGIGESLAIHLGDCRWMVVDSHKLARGGGPAALRYLRELRVDPSEQLDVVLVTHWHDDHIRGVSEIVAAAPRARFYCSAAWKLDEFVFIVEYMSRRRDRGPVPDLAAAEGRGPSSGIRELGAVFDRLESRGQRPRWVGEDRVVVPPRPNGCSVTAIAPSDQTRDNAQVAFQSIKGNILERDRVIPFPRPNDLSVALWLDGTSVAVLGGDLVNTGDPATGWFGVTRAATFRPREAAVMKVPHHGSKSAYSEEIWREIAAQDCTAIASGYTRLADPLPTAEDRAWLSARAKRVYLAGLPSVPDLPADGLEPLRRLAAPVRRRRSGGLGHIRCRLDPKSRRWRVEYGGNAIAIGIDRDE